MSEQEEAVNLAETLDHHSKMMVQMFVEHSNEVGDLDKEGYSLLSMIFGDIPREYRALIFEEFLDNLDEMGIPYNVKEFRGEIH